MLRFAETQIYRYLQQGHHNNLSVSIASLRVVPIPPPPLPPTLHLGTMPTSDDAGYSGRLRSSTRPILEAQGEGRERSRSCHSRRGGRAENLDDDSDSNTSQQHGTPTDHLDSPVDEAEKLLPGAETLRRQISPASREHLQLSSEHHLRHLTSPRSTERLPQSYGDQRSHAGPSDSDSEISRAQRALDEANATLLRREERRRLDDERRHREDHALDQARAVAREASRAVERARQAVALSATSTPARATPSPARPLGVASQETRPGDDVFMSSSVQYMATTSRVNFSAHLAEALIAAATALLTSERRSSFKAEDLWVGVVWARRDNSSAFGQMRRAPTLALVNALRLAHDDAPDPVLWPTPKEALEGRRSTKQRHGGSRDRGDRNRGGGNSGGGGGQAGGNGENGGGGGHHNRRGGGNGGGSAGGASGTGGGPQRRQGSNQAEPTGAAVAAREEAPEDGETAHEGLQRGTTLQRPPICLRARTRTMAR